MPPLSRATSPSSSRRSSYPAVPAVRKRGSKTRRPGELSLAAAGLDLTSRLRTFQRQLRRQVERRDTLMDIVRAMSTTLDPAEIADLLVERAAGWIPAPSWAVVSSDLSARLQVLAGRGLTPEMGPALHSVANWVMYRGEDFTSENLRVGWGKEGRTRFWGGLGLCPACKRLSVVDLSAKLDMHRCKECQGQLTLLEGLSQDIPCPECTKVLRSTNLGVWN